MSEKYKRFTDRNNIVAIVGASTDRDKFGYKIFKSVIDEGYRKVYPVNPKYKKIDNIRCFPDLQSLPEKPDVVITVVPPKVTEKVVESCKDLEINMVWMQPGSESKKALELCRKNGIDTLYNICFVVDGLGKGLELKEST